MNKSIRRASLVLLCLCLLFNYTGAQAAASLLPLSLGSLSDLFRPGFRQQMLSLMRRGTVFSSPEEPLEKNGFESIKTFPADTGVYVWGVGEDGDNALFMGPTDNGWIIVQIPRVRLFFLHSQDEQNVFNVKCYQADDERLSLLYIIASKSSEEGMPDPSAPEISDTAGRKYELFSEQMDSISIVEFYVVWSQYIGLGDVNEEGFNLLGYD